MKRSEILKILARRLSNREVDDIYEAAISEMVFVQRAVLEKLPNQPWFLQRESIFPLPVGEEFIQLPEDYNGLMTRGGVWFAPAVLKSAFICGPEWDLMEDKFADKEVITPSGSTMQPLFGRGLTAPDSVLTTRTVYNSSIGDIYIDEEIDGVAVAVTYTYGGFLFAYKKEGSLAYTTPEDFSPDKVHFYFRPSIDSNFAQEGAYLFVLARDEHLDGNSIQEVARVEFTLPYSEYELDPTKVYKVTFDAPGSFNVISIMGNYVGLTLLDAVLCKDNALMPWDFSKELEILY